MNIRDIRKKIKSVKNVRKITNAMHMVSAVKMKKSQKIALEGREYRHALFSMLHTLLQSHQTDDLKIPLLMQTQGTKKLYILMTSHKGLCGAFHTRLFQFLTKTCDSDSDFIAVGQKGAQFIAHTSRSLIGDFASHASRDETLSALYAFTEDKFLTGEYASVSLIYNSFVNSMKSEPVCVQIMPIQSLDDVAGEPLDAQRPTYVIEPSAEVVFPRLLQDYVREKLRSAYADSDASEHSARMMAMKTATDNAQDVADSLTLMRNTVRQTQITNELLDMIAGMNS